jgi:hypothetical protein
MREVIIGPPDGDHIVLRVHGRSHPSATDYEDGNWVEAQVSISVRPWRGVFKANLRTDEFARFRQELEELNNRTKPEAMFAPMEPWLEFTLELGSSGEVHLKGESGPEGFGRVFNETRLEFEARDFMDQASLPSVIQQLEAIEREFPVIGETVR